MIAMNSVSRDGLSKHPFQSIEDELRIVFAAWQSGGTFDGPLEKKAIETICKAMEAIAAYIFSKWGFRNCEEEAREVAQEWFARMWKTGLTRYDSDRLLCIYAYTVFVRVCFSHGRKERRRGTCLDFELADESEGPDQIAMAEEVRSDIDEAMKSLTPNSRGALRRLYWGDESSGSQETVHGRAFRGRALLRARLAKHANGNVKGRVVP
jgi:RNA polymerase sigma factor (sigma-70 family)